MLERVAHIFGFGKKDEAVARRFAGLKARYGEQSKEDLDLVTQARSAFRLRTVVGAQTTGTTREAINRSLLQSYAVSAADRDRELVGAGK